MERIWSATKAIPFGESRVVVYQEDGKLYRFVSRSFRGAGISCVAVDDGLLKQNPITQEDFDKIKEAFSGDDLDIRCLTSHV